jgi:DNA-binding HxlR family transcriptional regulator
MDLVDWKIVGFVQNCAQQQIRYRMRTQNMKWEDLPDQQCSMARSLSVLGDRWTLLILSDCFLGVKRFEIFSQRLRISRTTLTDRLNQLGKAGILSLQAYQQNPVRNEYKLTAKGLDLYQVVISLVHWGDKYYADDAGPPVLHHHKDCDHDFEPIVACSHCANPVSAKQTIARKRPENCEFPPVLRGPVKL